MPPEPLPPHRSSGSAPGRFGVRALGRKKQPVEREIKLGLSEPADFIPTKMRTKPVFTSELNLIKPEKMMLDELIEENMNG